MEKKNIHTQPSSTMLVFQLKRAALGLANALIFKLVGHQVLPPDQIGSLGRNLSLHGWQGEEGLLILSALVEDVFGLEPSCSL